MLRKTGSSLAIALVLAACSTTEPVRVGDAGWAQPVVAEGPSNWYRVSEGLYRCAQPSHEDMEALEAYGVRAVVNLRERHSDCDEVEGTQLRLFEVPLDTSSLSYDAVVDALAAVLDAPKPVAVHCWRGSDRTGTVIAAWRVAFDGWTPQQALAEMVSGGYGHFRLFGHLRELVASLDADRLRDDVARRRRAVEGP